MVDVIPLLERGSMLCELLYADDLFPMHETSNGLGNKFIKWKYSFQNNGLKVNFGTTKLKSVLAL